MSATLLLSLLLAAAVPAPAPAHRPAPVALVIAQPEADVPGLAPLRWADDDGLRWAETLTRLGAEVELLGSLDAETAATAGEWKARLRPATSAELDAAVARMAARIAAEPGREALFVYVGHGTTDAQGRDQLTLQGSRLDRAALAVRVVAKLPAAHLHLLIDACRAGGVVGHRGSEDEAVLAQLRTLLDREQSGFGPHVGVLWAQSADGRTHEWSRLRAGVFSHVVRSGLLGGADSNRDDAISWGELEAFVVAALGGIQDVRARLEVHASPPDGDSRLPLIVGAPLGPELRVPAVQEEQRLAVTDLEGTPLLDVNRSQGEPLRLRLPERRGYWLRTPSTESRLEAHPERHPWPRLQPIELASRGPEADAFSQGLFALEYGRGFEQGYALSLGRPLETVRVQAAPEESTASTEGFRPVATVALTAGRATLSRGAVATGVDGLIGVRLPDSPWRLGLHLGWSVAPNGWLDGTSALHRLAAGPSLSRSFELGRWTPFVEGGAQWLGVLATLPAGLRGDLSAFGGRLAGGTELRAGPIDLRFAATLEADGVRLDGARTLCWLPGVEVGVAF